MEEIIRILNDLESKIMSCYGSRKELTELIALVRFKLYPIYYAVILDSDTNEIKLTPLTRDKELLEKLYPKAKIVEVAIGQ